MYENLETPRDPAQETTVGPEVLQEFLQNLLVQKGMFAAQAEVAAERMVEADLRGIQSHGSRCIGRYLEAMDLGDIDPRAQVVTLSETPAMAVLDGGKGLGHVAATKAMQMAIEKAREVGTGTVAVGRSHHYGAAGVYVLMAAEAGLIGFSTTSTGKATVLAHGSRQPATGNHPIAWAAPRQNGPPFVLDMACGKASWGKVETLRMYGLPLPETWALDEDGRPTDDPAAAQTLLPAAGARGTGLAFLASILAGPLVGGKMALHKTRPPYVEGSEHFFYCIDPGHFADLERYYEEVESTMQEISGFHPAEGFDRVRLPGQLEAERAEQWKKEGIPLHREHLAGLEELGRDMNVEVPWSAHDR